MKYDTTIALKVARRPLRRFFSIPGLGFEILGLTVAEKKEFFRGGGLFWHNGHI